MEKNSEKLQNEKKSGNLEVFPHSFQAEGFQFSFNGAKQEKQPVEDSPSPSNENLIEKLTALKSQMQTINLKIQETSEKVAEKQKKTEELKSLLIIRQGHSKASESSQVSCACRDDCSLL
jgi:hypothetical protein